MKCKFCGEEMPDNGKFCPYCGLDNSQEAAQEPQQPVDEQEIQLEAEAEAPQVETAPEAEPRANVKGWKRGAIISGCVAVMAVLALVLFFGIRGEAIDVSGWFSWSAFRDNDIYKKDSYTVSDKKAQAKADVVVATVGDAQLTNSQLQAYYQLEVINFVSNYSYYLSYLGLDYTQPLDEQDCPLAEGYTWQQYFLESALASWQQYQILALVAEANDFQMDEEMQSYLDNMAETMQETADAYGYDSLEEFFHNQLGVNTDLEDYRHYMTVYYTSYLYFAQVYEDIESNTLTGEALENYFQENEEALNEEGIYQDGSYTIDIRHILIAAVDLEGTSYGTDNGDGTFTYPDETLAAEAKAEAERILELWLDEPTEEYFAELAEEYTQDSNGEDGGLYEGIAEGDMVAYFDDWCFDEERQTGDYAIVETKFGYHIMYFVQRGEDTWIAETQSYYNSTQAQLFLESVMGDYEAQIDYSKIALAYVPMDTSATS